MRFLIIVFITIIEKCLIYTNVLGDCVCNFMVFLKKHHIYCDYFCGKNNLFYVNLQLLETKPEKLKINRICLI